MKKARKSKNYSIESMLDEKGLPSATPEEINTLVDYGLMKGWMDSTHYESIRQSMDSGKNHKAFALSLACLYNTLLSKDRQIDDLSRIANTDPLTGLNNRRGIDEIIEKRSASGDYAVVYFDVDNFKRFNDNHGHHVGDLVLKYVGETVKECVREDDSGRYGGEEFIVVLKNSDIKGAEGVAYRLRHAIKENACRRVINHLQENMDYESARKLEGVNITASFGVASKSEGKVPLDVINLADKRMYHAKHKMGRNAVCTDKIYRLGV